MYALVMPHPGQDMPVSSLNRQAISKIFIATTSTAIEASVIIFSESFCFFIDAPKTKRECFKTKYSRLLLLCELCRNTAGKRALLGLIFLIRHLKYLYAKDDTLNKVNDFDDTAGNNAKNDTKDTGLNLSLHKAGNADAVENDAHYAKEYSVIHNNTSHNLLALSV